MASQETPKNTEAKANKPVATIDDGHAHEISGGSITAAVFGIVKAMVGPAILYLPHSFADAGYAFAIVALWMCTFLYLFTSNRLLATWRYVRQQQEQKREAKGSHVELEMTFLADKTKVTKRKNTNNGEEEQSLSDHHESVTGKEEMLYAFDAPAAPITSISYPQLAKMAYGEAGESAVRAGITLMQLGVCLTYFIFVPHNLSASIKSLTGIRLPLWACLVGMVGIEIPLSSIRNVQKLVTTNVIATCLIAFGLVCCLYLATFGQEDARLDLLDMELNKTLQSDRQEEEEVWGEELESQILNKHHLSPWNDHWYLFIGTSVLLFEGSITLCIPLQEALQVPSPEIAFPRVYNQTITSIVTFYTFFGFVCWSAFGDDVSTVLTTSLPDGVLTTVVQLAYSIAVIFTFPLQIFPAMEIIAQFVERRMQESSENGSLELTSAQRSGLVSLVIIVLSIIAVVEMDNLGKVVALMGSLLGCPLAFVFPPLIHSKLVPSAPSSDKTIAAFGMLAMIGATLITLATWSEPGGERRQLHVTSVLGLD